VVQSVNRLLHSRRIIITGFLKAAQYCVAVTE